MNLVDSSPRSLGRFEIGALGFGTWRFVNLDNKSATELLETALGLGANLVDCADVYGLDWGGPGFGAAETALGDVFEASPELRDRCVLATKGGIRLGVPYDSSGEYLTSACEASLKRLKTDFVDLYQIHRPDLFTHPEALANTLTRLWERGLIREVGVSNYSASQTAALAKFLPFPIASIQPQFSLKHLDPMLDGTIDGAIDLGANVLAWSPLAGGDLATGDLVNPELLAELDSLAHREEVERADISLAFVLSHPAKIVPIVGTANAQRLGSYRRALDVSLDRSDVYRLVEAATGEKLP